MPHTIIHLNTFHPTLLLEEEKKMIRSSNNSVIVGMLAGHCVRKKDLESLSSYFASRLANENSFLLICNLGPHWSLTIQDHCLQFSDGCSTKMHIFCKKKISNIVFWIDLHLFPFLSFCFSLSNQLFLGNFYLNYF